LNPATGTGPAASIFGCGSLRNKPTRALLTGAVELAQDAAVPLDCWSSLAGAGE
jgi:hypothetical protein